VRTETRLFLAPVADAVANHAHWVPVAGFEDEITDASIDADTIYLLANKGHRAGAFSRPLSPPRRWRARPKWLRKASWSSRDWQRAKDGLYLDMLDGGISRLRRLTRDDRVAEIALPFAGNPARTGVQRD